MKSQLEKDIARNRRIIAFILKQYQVNNHYNLPNVVDQFISTLLRDIDKAETWMRNAAVK